MRKILSMLVCTLTIAAGLQAQPIAAPTVPAESDLTGITEEQIQGKNALSSYILEVIEATDGEQNIDKEVKALKSSLTREAGYFYLVATFLGNWGNGGMQQILICEPDEIPKRQVLLQNTVDAFRYYGSLHTAEFLSGLVAKSKTWSEDVARLQKENAPEAQIESVMTSVEELDAELEKEMEKDPVVYEAIYKDVTAHPQKYLKKE